MKNIFKIATISALVMLSANAMAEDATQDFTWTGTVPAASAGTGIKIINTGSGTALDAGVFSLTKTADYSNSSYGYFDITSASLLSFDVVTDDASEDHVDYYYTMTSFTTASGATVSSGGQLGGVTLTADGTHLLRGAKTTTAATASTNLTLAGNAVFLYGKEYALTATMLITDQAI